MRFSRSLVNDIRLQVRYGLYGVTGLVILVWGALLGMSARMVALSAPLLLPPFVLGNLVITTFYFMAALVMFEKGEGVLATLVVTPLRASEYLLSKIITLTLLATVETLVIAVLIFRGGFGWGGVLLGAISGGVILGAAGFLTAVRYDKFDQFLMPSVVVVTLLYLPLLSHFGAVDSRLMLLHPLEPAMLLMRGGGAIAAAGAVFWCIVAVGLACRAFRRFVVRT